MSATWLQHKATLDALMAQYGVNPMPAAPSAPAPAAPSAPASVPTFGGSVFSNPSTTDTSLWDYMNRLNAQQTGLGPTGENISALGAGYGGDGLRMSEFGNAGYAGGPAGTGPDLSGLMGGMNISGSTVVGLLGALGGSLVGGPFGGLLGGLGGRALGGLFGGGSGTAASGYGGSQMPGDFTTGGWGGWADIAQAMGPTAGSAPSSSRDGIEVQNL